LNALEIGKIHPTVIVGENVTFGKNVTIGAGSIIYDHVRLKDNVIVGPHSIVGEPLASVYDNLFYQNPELVISENSLIRSHAIIYAGSQIGPGFSCGHRVTIREGTKIGQNVRIGTLCDIQGDCSIGDYVRLHSNVHIGMKSSIGNYVWIFPYVVLTNDPHPPSETLLGVTIEEFAVIATMSVILPGVRVGKDALIGASSMVRKDVPAEMVVAGNPAKEIISVREIKNKRTGEAVYPWRYTFDRGMPWQGTSFETWFQNRNPKEN
jgi:acetyltransferase-like isoleucine patch superfamily enzyme